MNKQPTIGVDLAKNVISVVRLSKSAKVSHSNDFSRRKFRNYLATQKASLVAFEACATAHYWSRVARLFGHNTKILPALSVAPFRQGHKTDQNDALAVAEAANRPNLKEAPFKTIEQQTIQAIQRSRDILVSERTGLSNHIRGILLEFGFALRQGFHALHAHVPDILEDGENELPDSYRATLNILYVRLLNLRDDIQLMDKQIDIQIKQHEPCSRLMALEGVGPISAILLYASLGTGEAFKNGREYSAYLGLTPKQYSSGGKVNLVGISKRIANKKLRSILIQGARSYIHRAKIGNSTKDHWLLALVDRAGAGKAAVALANKNVRTAWALLTQGTEYHKTEQPLIV